MIKITDSMVFFKGLLLPKFVSNITKICFNTYLNHPINQKKHLKKEKPKAITVLKKEGGGPARYDYDHRFNGFFYPLP